MEQLRFARPISARPLPTIELLQLIAEIEEILAPFDYPDAGRALRRALENIGDPQELFNAGYELINIGLDQLAVPILASAHAAQPDDSRTILELASALEGSWAYREAADLLRINERLLIEATSTRYLLAHDAAMSGDLEITRDLLPALTGPAPVQMTMSQTAHARVARFDAILASPKTPELRAWELVLNGCLVLTKSNIDSEAMQGREGVANEKPAEVASRAAALSAVLISIGRRPSRICHAPDRDSLILAWVVARQFGLDAPVPADPETRRVGDLVVAYVWPSDGSMGPFADDLAVILYAHHLNWTAPAWPAPDIVGAETQRPIAPWSGADDWEPAAIADDIVSIETDVAADVQACTDLLDALSASQAGFGFLSGHRSRFCPGGPVVSQRSL